MGKKTSRRCLGEGALLLSLTGAVAQALGAAEAIMSVKASKAVRLALLGTFGSLIARCTTTLVERAGTAIVLKVATTTLIAVKGALRFAIPVATAIGALVAAVRRAIAPGLLVGIKATISALLVIEALVGTLEVARAGLVETRLAGFTVTLRVTLAAARIAVTGKTGLAAAALACRFAATVAALAIAARLSAAVTALSSRPTASCDAAALLVSAFVVIHGSPAIQCRPA